MSYPCRAGEVRVVADPTPGNLKEWAGARERTRRHAASSAHSVLGGWERQRGRERGKTTRMIMRVVPLLLRGGREGEH